MNDVTPNEPVQPGWFAQPGAEMRATAADKGIVERPALAPHLEWRPVGEDSVLLFSETSSAALYGRRYVDMVPLLDGVRTRNEVVAALDGKHSRIEIQTALVSLATKGHIVSADHGMDRRMAAFWTSMRVTPRWVEERLASARVAVRGNGGDRLAAALREMGVGAAAEGAGAAPALSVILTGDYLEQALAETNERQLASGVPWAPVCLDGVWPLLGPVYRPADAARVGRASRTACAATARSRVSSARRRGTRACARRAPRRRSLPTPCTSWRRSSSPCG